MTPNPDTKQQPAATARTREEWALRLKEYKALGPPRLDPTQLRLLSELENELLDALSRPAPQSVEQAKADMELLRGYARTERDNAAIDRKAGADFTSRCAEQRAAQLEAIAARLAAQPAEPAAEQKPVGEDVIRMAAKAAANAVCDDAPTKGDVELIELAIRPILSRLAAQPAADPTSAGQPAAPAPMDKDVEALAAYKRRDELFRDKLRREGFPTGTVDEIDPDTAILPLLAKIAELEEAVESGLQLTGSFFEALKPLNLQQINVNNPGAHVTDLIQLVRSQAEQMQGMRKALEQLPKTKDGVPITPGMTLYDAKAKEEVLATSVTMFNSILTPLNDSDGEYPIADCYSTREAAGTPTAAFLRGLPV